MEAPKEPTDCNDDRAQIDRSNSKTKRKLSPGKETLKNEEDKIEESNPKPGEDVHENTLVAKRLKLDKLEQIQKDVSNGKDMEKDNELQKVSPGQEQSDLCSVNIEKEKPKEGNDREKDADTCACSFCDFRGKNPTALKVHVTRRHSHSTASSPSQASSAEKESTVSKNDLCRKGNASIPSSKEVASDYDEPTKKSRIKSTNGNNCPHCDYRTEHLASMDEHIKKNHKEKTFTCECCCFQCHDDSTLQAHYLGKTHLRRQNLAAKGRLVNVLTKKQNKTKPSKCSQSSDPESSINSLLIPASDEMEVDILPEKKDTKDPNAETTQQNLASSEIEDEEDNSKAKTPPKAKRFKGVKQNAPDDDGDDDDGGSDVQSATDRKQSSKEKLGSQTVEQDCAANECVNRRNANEVHLVCSPKEKILQDKDTKIVDVNAKDSLLGEKQAESEIKPNDTTTESSFNAEATSETIINEVNIELPQENESSSSSFILNLQSVENVEVELQGSEMSSEQESSIGKDTSNSKSSKGGAKRKPPSSNQKPPYVCSYCSYEFQSKLGLEHHIGRRHTKEMKFFCETCLYSCVVKGDFDKHCQSNKHQLRKNVTEIEVQIPRDQVKPSITRVVAVNLLKRSTHSKPQLQCKKCLYKTKHSSVLLKHIQVKHEKEYHFCCKVCNYYTVTFEGMEKHTNRRKHLQKAKKSNLGISSEDIIEEVCISMSAIPKKSKQPTFSSTVNTKEKNNKNSHDGRLSDVENTTLEESSGNMEGIIVTDTMMAPTSRKSKRGRPKATASTKCQHCGIVASSIANLNVHIKRRHSHQYSYACKLCNFFSVTKGDMDRHCATKKHINREGTALKASPENEPASLDGVVVEVQHVEQNAEKSEETEHQSSVINALRACKICKYYCIRKDDMDRHCATKKHNSRKVMAMKINQEMKPVSPDDVLEASHKEQGTNKSDESENESSAIKSHALKACKVCKYYCILKEDMDRHCSTKKHKAHKLLTVKANPQTEQVSLDSSVAIAHNGQYILNAGDQLQDIKANIGLDPENQTEAVINQAKKEHTVEAEIPEDCFPSQNQDGHAQVLDDSPSTKMKDVAVNSCSHCSFVAHSLSSLDLHVKRKHTKDFEYLCMGCNYYAVTRREMTRHAATEKHKLKSQAYLLKLKETAEVLPVETTAKCGGEDELQEESHNETQQESPSESVSVNTTVMENKENDTNVTGGTVENRNTESTRLPLESVTSEDSEGNNLENSQDLHSGGCGTKTGEGQKINIQVVECEEGDIAEKAKIDAQHETEEAVKNSVWETDESVTEGLQVDGNLELQESNLAGQSQTKELSRAVKFDASIVMLKNYSDVEYTDYEGGQSSEGLASGNENLQPVRKKRRSSQIEKPRIRCEDCGFLADGLSGLNVHISMKHPTKEKTFHCLLCGKSFYTESNLHQHLTSAGHLRNEQASIEELPEGGATFKCVKCTDPFNSEQELFMHIKEKHEELLREVNKYILEDTEQINNEREENRGNICKYCGKICKSSNSMAFLAHIRTHTGSKPFRCKLCKFATAQLGDARNHVKRHLGMREYKCHVCGWAFVMKKHLNTHLLGKHGVGTPKERKFECKLCDRSFSEKWALNNHMKLHIGEKPFKCAWPTCHYSFLTLSAMKDHYRTHTGEKSFLCDLCGFAGGTRHALTKHRRQHTGEKPFKCELCNFASTTQSHLTRHKRVHTGEKPYRCPWCDYRSNCAENIRKHILHTGKHEGVKMYNCPRCDYGSNSPTDFRNHLKESHPDLENPDLAYLHAGIVSKSFECRLKGHGASFVETDTPFTAAAEESSPVKERVLRISRKEEESQAESVQQVIIIQGFPEGYGGEFSIDSSMEESAAATLQTLAMAGQVAEVVHITEDGQVISTSGVTTRMSSMIPSQIQLPAGTTQVVVVEAPVEGATCGEMLAAQEVHTASSSSALDALLCAVTELGQAQDRQEQQNTAEANHEESLPEGYESQVVTTEVASETVTEEMQVFHEMQDDTEPMEGVTQVVQSSSVPTFQESAPTTYKDMVQEVLKLAMCDMATGVTQVIVNDEGTVHMMSREGQQIIMQEAGGHGIEVPNHRMDLVSSNGEMIIVTEGIARAMVQNSGQNFSDGNTHYIVTELDDSTLQVEGTVYSQNDQEESPCPQTVYQTEEESMIGEEMETSPAATRVVEEQLEGMVVYTDSTFQEHVIDECSDSMQELETKERQPAEST
ncbi:zinc finger protein 407-like [Huso huso]|uniref:Zinc finger protein 407-like n=1 Tax=Huso huso TaxID=61971 RepID=A0ABR1A3E2_HUSHU